MWRLRLPLLLLLLPSCWVSPDSNLWHREVGVDQSRMDLGPTDSAGDLPSHDLPALDAPPVDAPRPDVGPPPKLTCGSQAAVGVSQPTSLREVALTPDRLTLVARGSGKHYSASRPATGQAFGSWSTTTLIDAGMADPTFFTYKGKDQLIIARHFPTTSDPRRLELCSFPGLSCSALPVEDTGGVVSYDMDGASVAVVGGTVLMAHNIGVGGTSTADIYIAEPKNLSDLSKGFTTSPVATINQASVKEDDPAISPDGLVILYSAPSTAGDADLWISQRASLSDPFSTPEQLAGVNTTSSENSAYLAPMSSVAGKTRFELFFSSDRSGKMMVYRSKCTR